MISSPFGHSGTYLSQVADTEKNRKEFGSASPNLEMTTTQYSLEMSQNGKHEVFGCVNKKQHKLESIFIFAVS